MKKKFNGILMLLLALVVQISFAQEKTISGTVSDETGPLPGVNVIVKGTSNGTQTDFDGNYMLKSNVGDVLVFSFVGMTTIEKTVGASNTINATMQGSNVLEEVVIMGYGTKKKNELTGSTVQLNADQIAEVPDASVDQVLQGKVAGLTITGTSGTPGSVQNIRIRGISSITAGNSPLFVIDGVPVVNFDVSGTTAGSSLTSLASLNSDDIQSMTVLKDASATSAYGARGANGVIVITTKSGKRGAPTFNFTTSVGIANDAIKGRDVLTAQQTIDLGYQALVNTGYYDTVAEARADYDWPMDYWGYEEGKDGEPKWGDVIKNENALQQTYNLSAQGGNEASRYYASLGYYGSEATVLGTDFEKINASLNFSTDFSDKLKFSTNSSFSNSQQNGVLEASAYFSSPRVAKYFLNPMAGMPYNDDGSINLDLASNVRNPLYIMDNDIHENVLSRLMNNSTLEWKVIENLTLKTNFAVDYIIRDYKEYQNRVYGDGADVNGYGWQSNYQNVNYVWVNSADYRWRINEDHRVDFKVLMEYQKNKSRSLAAEGEEFSTDGLTNLDTAGKPTGSYASIFDWYSVSYMAMANYALSNKVYVDLTYRYEGSSKFPSDNRFGNFWSVGAAYNISEEAFLENSSVIDDLKLRASYGVNGNNNIDVNTYQAFFGYDANYGGVGAAYPSQFGNSKLSWENNALLDVGFDISLWDSFFKGTFSYYNRRTYDLLLEVPLSLTTGHDSQNTNVGEMSNKGFEVELNFNLITKDEMNLSFGGNLATVENEVTKLAKDANGELIEIETGTRLTTEGQPVAAWNMRKYAGVNPENGAAQWFLNGKDGELTEVYSEAQKALQDGSALPTLTAGLNIHFDYKGFFVDADGYYAGGHKLFEEWAAYTHQGGLYNFGLFQGVADLNNAWTPTNTDTDVPAVLWNYDRDRSSTSTRFLYDGDYMRLKNLTVGYNFSSDLLAKTFLTGVRVYARGTNLATWVKDDRLKQDPEVAADGFIGLTTPPTKSFIFGVNLKF